VNLNLSPVAGGGDEIQAGAYGHRLLAHQLQSEVAGVGCLWVETAAVVGYHQGHI
jgi:hypothetical protein